MALQTLSALFQRDAKPTLKDPLRFLQEAVLAGHHQLLHYATERGLMDTPRTTVVACVLQGQSVYWAHCGDSRLYLVRDGKLVTRTRDHSYTELQGALAQSGQPIPLDAQRFNRNVLFTCLGSPGKPVVDTAGPTVLQSGDRLMLCSDGLWGAVADEAIVDTLARHTVSDAVPELAEMALRSAGAKSDNVTLLALEWEGAEGADEAPVVHTRSLGDEVFASTIQASLAAGEAPVEELDDAEIERSIREINEAIKRSSLKKP
jgi:serine/threonine protein phosphatase PrpC